jgi:hypothetical protein
MRHHQQLLLQLQLHLLWVNWLTGYLPLQQLQTAQQQPRLVSEHAHAHNCSMLVAVTSLDGLLVS